MKCLRPSDEWLLEVENECAEDDAPTATAAAGDGTAAAAAAAADGVRASKRVVFAETTRVVSCAAPSVDADGFAAGRVRRVHAAPRRIAALNAEPLRINRVEPEGRPRKNGFVNMRLQVSCDGKEKAINATTLVDSGAEADFISPALAARLPLGAISPLRAGDITTIELADRQAKVAVQGVVHAQVRFGDDEFRHSFYMANLQYEAIIGSHFFGIFQSSVSYEDGDMTFMPSGIKGARVPMFEERNGQPRTGVRAFKVGAGRVTQDSTQQTEHRQALQQAFKKPQLLRVARDTILNPLTESHIDVLPHRQVNGVGRACVLLTADVPEASANSRKMAGQDVRILETIDEFAPGRVLRMVAANESPLPVFLRKGAVVGAVVLPDEVHELPRHGDEKELAATLASCAMRFMEERASVSTCADSAELPSFREMQQREDAERAAHRQQVAAKHNAGLERCTEADLKELFTHEGRVNTLLEGKAKDGTPLQ